MSSIPSDLRYTTQHEWVSVTPEGLIRVGITDFAQAALGDIVFADVPQKGATVTAEESMGEVESTKSVSDIYAPVSGTIIRSNEILGQQPETINEDPYGQGWLVEIQMPDDVTVDSALSNLLDAKGYAEITTSTNT